MARPYTFHPSLNLCAREAFAVRSIPFSWSRGPTSRGAQQCCNCAKPHFGDHDHIVSEPAPLMVAVTGTDFIMRAQRWKRRPPMHAMPNLDSQTTSAGGVKEDNRADTKAISRAIRDADRG